MKLCIVVFFVVTRTMGLCRSILPPDKTGKMDCKNGRKDKKSCQKADLCHVLKVLSLELLLAIFTLFGSVVKKRLGSCIQSIRFSM